MFRSVWGVESDSWVGHEDDQVDYNRSREGCG